MDAARLWNTNPTSEGKATIGLPISTLSSTTKLPSSYSTSELILRIAQLNRELAITFIPTDKTNKQFEKTALEFELKKRADQPTVSLADQEKAADLLSTVDLIKRANALPMEIAVMAPSPARTDRQLEQEAVNRAIKKRTMIVIVHVHDTNDVFSDNVYVVASTLFAGYWKSDVVDLNDGQENKWMVPLSDVFPVAGLQPDLAPVIVQAYDEDIISADDLMFGALWLWSELPKVETQEMSGGKYTVRVDLT
jgi:hypothetical protein